MDNEASGYIQWKGTVVCMDIYCICNALSHLDSDFAYYIKCPKCGRVYRSDTYITLRLVEPDELAAIPVVSIKEGELEEGLK